MTRRFATTMRWPAAGAVLALFLVGGGLWMYSARNPASMRPLAGHVADEIAGGEIDPDAAAEGAAAGAEHAAADPSSPEVTVRNLPADVRHGAIIASMEKLVETVSNEAHLPPETRGRVDAILREERETAFALTSSTSDADFPALGAKLSVIHQEAERKLAEILTPEQLAVYYRHQRPPAAKAP